MRVFLVSCVDAQARAAVTFTYDPCMRRMSLKFLLIALGVSLVGALAGLAQMKPGDRRKAYGVRAPIMEAVLAALYPGAQVQWDPALTVQIPGQKPRMVEVPVSLQGDPVTRGIMGVASIEFDGAKEQFIFQAQSFRRTDNPVFPTVLIVFRADTAFHLTKYKKLFLDPGQPCSELKTMSIQDWPAQKEWPTVAIQYDTHVARRDSFTTVEWHGVLDANTGQFINRIPLGFSRTVRGGQEELHPFGIRRVNANTVDIVDLMNRASHPYNCSDPCAVDPQTLLSQWAQ